MKYNDENLDISKIEILPERKRSFFSWGNLLNTLILFGVVSLFCSLFCCVRYDFSVLDDMDYEIPLRKIIIISNGFDIYNLILPVSITITLLLRATKLNIIEWFKYDFKGACGCLFGLLFIFIHIIEFIIYLSYAYFIKEENAKNTGKPYIVNVDIKRIPDSTRGKDWIIFVFNDREVYIRNYYKHEYLRDLKSASNKKISLVVRNGSHGIPIIDDYKIFYNNDIYNELEVPKTVEEFYNDYNAYKKEEDSVISNDTLYLDKETEYVAKDGTNRKTDRFGNYFEKRMPQISSEVTGRLTASCYVTKEGDVKNVKLTNGLTISANNALIKAIGDMGGKWKGKPIDGAAKVCIEIDYANGHAHYMFVEVSISGTSRRYKDCYGLNSYGSFYSERIDM